MDTDQGSHLLFLIGVVVHERDDLFGADQIDHWGDA